MSTDELRRKAAQDTFARLAANIARAVNGQDTVVRHLLSAFLTGGHVLLEDSPGTGKTTLAKALARSVGAAFQRIQFTPDLLPTDILGASIYDQHTQQFVLHRGPIFTHILLADEINRASPRTQAALLEAMGEGQISLEGQRFALEPPFFVIATQNPIEFHGTYPLPEAQLDRFALRLALGYVPLETEMAIVRGQAAGHPLDTLDPVVDIAAVNDFEQTARALTVSEEVLRYIVELVQSTRTAAEVELGASPRASLALMHCAQALALADGFDFVAPDHVQEIAQAVLAHRLALRPEARFAGASAALVVTRLLEGLPVPR